MTEKTDPTIVRSAGDGMLRLELQVTMEQMTAATARWLDAERAGLSRMVDERVREVLDPESVARAVEALATHLAEEAVERRVRELATEALDALVREQVTPDMVWRHLVAATAPSDAVEAMTRTVVEELLARALGKAKP